jgi:hypothetical protein
MTTAIDRKKWIGLVGILLTIIVIVLMVNMNIDAKQLSLPGFNIGSHGAPSPTNKCPELTEANRAELEQALRYYETGLTHKGGAMLRTAVERHLGPRPDLKLTAEVKTLLIVAKELLKC